MSTGRENLSHPAQRVLAKADEYHQAAGCQPHSIDCVICDLIGRVRSLEGSLGDCIALMSGAPSVAPMTDDLVLKNARKALYGEE